AALLLVNLQRDFLHVLLLHLHRLHRRASVLLRLLVVLLLVLRLLHLHLLLLHRRSGEGGGVGGGGVGGIGGGSGDGEIIGGGGGSGGSGGIEWRGDILHLLRRFLHLLLLFLHLLLVLEAPFFIVLELSIFLVEFGQILADDRFGDEYSEYDRQGQNPLGDVVFKKPIQSDSICTIGKKHENYTVCEPSIC